MTETWVIRRDCPGGPDWLHAWDDEHVAVFAARRNAVRCASLAEAREMLSQLRDRIEGYNENGGRNVGKLIYPRAFTGHTFTIEPFIGNSFTIEPEAE